MPLFQLVRDYINRYKSKATFKSSEQGHVLNLNELFITDFGVPDVEAITRFDALIDYY